jgi:hypothetical protein
MRYDIERACLGALTVIIAGPYETEDIAAMHRTRLTMQHDGEAPLPVYTVISHIEGDEEVTSVR